ATGLMVYVPLFDVDSVPFHTPASSAPSDMPKLSFQSCAALEAGLRMVKVPISPPVQEPASAYSAVRSDRSSADATWTAIPVAMSNAPAPRRGMKVLGLMARNAMAAGRPGEIL